MTTKPTRTEGSSGGSGMPESRATAPVRLAGGCRLAWIVLALTVVLGVSADLLSKSAAFEHLAGDPADVRRSSVLARQGAGVPIEARGELDAWLVSHHFGVDRSLLTPEVLAVMIPEHDPVVVLPSVLELKLGLNDGAVFGIGSGQRWVFITFTFFAIVVALTVFARALPASDRFSQVAIGLIIAGGLGNLYDRVVYACVRDFLHPFPGIPVPFGWGGPGGSGELWPYVSNVADKWLLLGIGVLLIRLWFAGPRGSAADGEAAGECEVSSRSA